MERRRAGGIDRRYLVLPAEVGGKKLRSRVSYWCTEETRGQCRYCPKPDASSFQGVTPVCYDQPLRVREELPFCQVIFIHSPSFLGAFGSGLAKIARVLVRVDHVAR